MQNYITSKTIDLKSQHNCTNNFHEHHHTTGNVGYYWKIHKKNVSTVRKIHYETENSYKQYGRRLRVSASVGLGYGLTVLSFYADLCVWSSSSNSPVSAHRYTEQSHSTATVCLHCSSKHKLIRET